jgi:hypothetical protein
MPTQTFNNFSDYLNSARNNVNVMTVAEDYNDSRWFNSLSEESRQLWNALCPYRLMILEYNPSTQTYAIASNGLASYTLPIPPQDLGITTNFAASLTPTLEAVTEEWNGVVLQPISLTGTTGVAPLRDLNPSYQAGFAGIFSNTLATINTVATGQTNIQPDSDYAGAQYGDTTGYYQFRLLQLFLQTYAVAKKSAKGANLRLCFAIYKNESAYLVMPNSFALRRTSSDPYEYTYNLNMTAWKTIDLDSLGSQVFGLDTILQDPNFFSKALNTLAQAQAAFTDIQSVMSAVKGDVEAFVMGPLRSTVLFLKYAKIGAVLSAADFPAQIIADLKQPLINAFGTRNLQATITNSAQITDQSVKDDIAAIQDAAAASGKSAGTATGDLEITSTANTLNDIFNNPSDHFEFLSLVNLSDLNLPVATQIKIQNEKNRVANFTRSDFQTFLSQAVDFSNDYANSVGAGSEVYDELTGVTVPISNNTPTNDDFSILFNLNDVIGTMQQLVLSSVQTPAVTSLDYITGLAQAAGLAFTEPTSKFAVPVPYGATLEAIAQQYLGDKTRWIDLAILNGLKTPYIDEVGFRVPLLTKGRGNQITVADATNLYLNQNAWLEASGTPRVACVVQNIVQTSAGYVLYLNQSGLETFTTQNGAVLHAFLPNTTNSMQSIYIPSDEPVSEIDFRSVSIPGINEMDPLIRAAGIDLLLTQTNDLAMTPDGDGRFAYGLQAIIQTINLKLAKLKSLVGSNTVQADVKSLRFYINSLLAEDSTFTGVSNVSIIKNGPAVSVSFSVSIKGVNTPIPVTVGL